MLNIKNFKYLYYKNYVYKKKFYIRIECLLFRMMLNYGIIFVKYGLQIDYKNK